MSKELEALERVKDDKKYNRCIGFDDLDIIETALKALEIIKKGFYFNFVEQYRKDFVPSFAFDLSNGNQSIRLYLAQEDYKLLKEVLL